jgi:hypothetical protein
MDKSMQLILKYHGDLSNYFSNDSEENMTRIDVDDEDSIYSVIDKFNIPREKINLILVNGVKVKEDDCATFRFSEGDVMAVWPAASH